MKKTVFFVAIVTMFFSKQSSCAMEEKPMKLNSKIYIAGHNGLVGSAILRKLRHEGFTNIVTRTSNELDLRTQHDVETFFAQEKPEYVFLSAGRGGGRGGGGGGGGVVVGGGGGGGGGVIHAAYKHSVKKLIFLGSSCIYPKRCPQPIKEAYLLTGALEPTNDAYAIAKIAGIKMCQSYNKQYGTNFIACMPTNLYGPHDNFDPITSHVLPALLRKFYEAKQTNKQNVAVWGTGKPYREFLYVDDLADAILFLTQNYKGNEIINIGTGIDLTIGDLAKKIKQVVGYEGDIVFDTTKPDGTPKKQLNIDKLKQLGWEPKISLDKGLQMTFNWCLEHTIFG